MSPLLSIRDLVVRRDKAVVLQVPRLDVEKGEVLALVGPNGAGKSTLLLAIAHLIKHAEGQIIFDGQRLNSRRDLAYRRRIGLVLQEPLLLDRSVYANAALGLQFRGVAHAEVNRRVNEWLDRMGISSLRDRRAGRISGGEAQRASLARAFVLQPDLLLLDEPFSSLDAPTRLRLLDDLRRILAETGTTTLFVTHDLGEARRLGQRMAVLLEGRLQQWGEPGAIYQAPENPDVAAFLGVE